MSNVLPRIVGIRSAAEPYKVYVCVTGADELAQRVRLPQGLPEIAVARQFMGDFNKGKLQPQPILFGARFTISEPEGEWREANRGKSV